MIRRSFTPRPCKFDARVLNPLEQDLICRPRGDLSVCRWRALAALRDTVRRKITGLENAPRDLVFERCVGTTFKSVDIKESLRCRANRERFTPQRHPTKAEREYGKRRKRKPSELSTRSLASRTGNKLRARELDVASLKRCDRYALAL
jgi:hypothetical protein